jgi:hypothetical protein
VGSLAFSVNFLMRRGGAWSTLVTVVLWAESAIAGAMSVFTRLDGGDVGGDVLCPVAVVIVWSILGGSCLFTAAIKSEWKSVRFKN